MEISSVYKITQWGYGEGAEKTPLYIAPVSFDIIDKKADIRRRKPSEKYNYQRALKTSRLKGGKESITNYIYEQCGSFPTSVLVNICKDDGYNIKFKKKGEIGKWIEVGDLTIPDDAPWHLLDGQHRIEGMSIAQASAEQPEYANELLSYPFIVTFTNQSLFYEMVTFYIVNSRAKPVPTDLVYRIMQRMVFDEKSPKWVTENLITKKRLRDAIAATIVDFLNDKESSPFHLKIQEVGGHSDYKKFPNPQYITNDKTMIRYTSRMLKTGGLGILTDEEAAEKLIQYFGAVKDTYPECFEKPEEYFLLRPVGLAIFTLLFPSVYTHCIEDQEISKENMKQYLEYLKVDNTPKANEIKGERAIKPEILKKIDTTWWHTISGAGILHGTGEGYFEGLAKDFHEKIAWNRKIKKVT